MVTSISHIYSISDTDECNTTNGGCEQVCTNILGSFYCSCNNGYQLQQDGSSCNGESNFI